MSTHQICTGCQINKSLSEFHKNSKYKSGHAYRCKVCVKIVSDKYYLEKGEQIRNTSQRIKKKFREKNSISPSDIVEKLCNRCNTTKPVNDFYKSSSSKDGYRYHCKECAKIERDTQVDYQKQYRIVNKEKRAKEGRDYVKRKMKTDIHFRLKTFLSQRIRYALKKVLTKKAYKTEILIGCTVKFLKEYLESKFVVNMTWENYGTEWHVDHIKPCASFDLVDIKQQEMCFHYTNLQPLFATTRIIDGIEYLGNINKREFIITEFQRKVA